MTSGNYLKDLKGMSPLDFEDWVCQQLGGKVSNRDDDKLGIDGWTSDGRAIQVKQSHKVGRVVVDQFETALRRKNKDKGVIVAFSFTKPAYEEVARAKMYDGVEIELKTVEELLNNNGVVTDIMNDEIQYPLKIDEKLWERFKETVPRTKTMNEALIELIREKVGEYHE